MKNLIFLFAMFALLCAIAPAQDWIVDGAIKLRTSEVLLECHCEVPAPIPPDVPPTPEICFYEIQSFAVRYILKSDNSFELTFLEWPDRYMRGLPITGTYQIVVILLERGFRLEIAGWGEMTMIAPGFVLMDYEFEPETYEVGVHYGVREITLLFVRHL